MISTHLTMDSLSHREKEYNISRNNCLCVIFNNVNFKNMERRLGSHEDSIQITETFRSLGFEVYTYIDCTCEQMRYYLSNLRNGQNNISCLFIVFLSHGDKDGIYGVMEERITFTEIQSCLVMHLRHLENTIPVVFIFQSCRDGERPSKDIIKYPRPISDHFLLVFATQPHCKAYRDHEKGSLFIQCLLAAIKEEPQETNVLSVLTRTNCLLGKSEWNKETNQRLQFNSLLLKDLHLPIRRQLQYGELDRNSCSDSDVSTESTQGEEESSLYRTIKPGFPTTILKCGLCLILNNSSHHKQEAHDKLKEKMEEQGYCVLSFNNINWSSMKILLEMASKVACKKFLLFVLSEGEQELVYDANQKEIKKRQIIDFFMGADNPMRDTHKLFYFQTTISDPRGAEAQKKERSTRESFLLPRNSICYQISSESSLIPCFLKTMQEYKEEFSKLPLRDILAHTRNEGKKSASPKEIICFHGSSNPSHNEHAADMTVHCKKEDMLLGYLMLVPQIKLTINLKLRKIYTKEAISGTEQDTFFCSFFFHEYDDITGESSQTSEATLTGQAQKSKDLIKARSICLIEEELHKIIDNTIKCFPVTEALKQELHTYQMCSRWTMTAFFESMTQTQCTDPKDVMCVHSEYADFSLGVVKLIRNELEKIKDQTPHIDQPLEEQNK